MHVLRPNSGVKCREISTWRGSGMAPGDRVQLARR